MWLELAHPLVAGRPCGECAQYLFNDDDTPTTRAGGAIRVVRPPGQPTPCHKCPKIPQGEPPLPESTRELTPQLRQVYRHYKRCKAVGRFPEDELVEENAAIIAEVEAAIEAGRWKMVEVAVKLLATVSPPKE